MKFIFTTHVARVLTLSLCLILFFNSCSKKGGAPDDPGGPGVIPADMLVADKSTYTPYQMMVLQIKKSAQTTGEKIKVTIGTKVTDAVVLSDSAVLLIAPEGLIGNELPVNFELRKVQYKGVVAIQTAVAAGDPDIYFNSFTQDISASLDALKMQVESDTAVWEGKSDVYDAIRVAKDSIAAFKTGYARLQPAEKAYLANFIKANYNSRPAFPEPLKEYVFGRKATQAFGRVQSLCDTNDPVWNYQCAVNAFITSVAEMSLWMVATYASAVPIQLAFPGVGTALATITTVLVVTELKDVIVFGKKVMVTKAVRAWAKAQELYESTSEYFKSVAVSGSMTEWKNDASSSFSFWSKFRNIQETDNASSISFLENAISKIKVFNDLAGKMSDKFKVKFVPAATIFRKPANISQLSIGVVNNQKVKLKSFSGTPDKLDLSFTTTESTDQDFEYDIIYKSTVYEEVKVRYKAKLVHPWYKVAYRANNNTINSEVNFFQNVQQEFKLVNDNGTNVTGLDYSQVSIGNNSNSKVTVSKTLLSSSDGFGITLNTSQTSAEKTTFDVLYGTKKVQTITGIVDDSLQFYKNKCIGNWAMQWYDANGPTDGSRYVFTEDGKGYCSHSISSTGVMTAITPWDYYNIITWTLVRRDGKYMLVFTHDNRNIGFSGTILYPNFTFRSNPVIGQTIPYVIVQKQ
jgi:hypothetical protein